MKLPRDLVIWLLIFAVSVIVFWHLAKASEPQPTVDWSNPDSIAAFAARVGDYQIDDPDENLERFCVLFEVQRGATPKSVGALGWWWNPKIKMDYKVCFADTPVPADLGRDMCARINLQFHKVEGPRVYCRDGEGA